MALKGFIFSLDALFAAMVLILAGMLFLSSVNIESPKEKQFDLVKKEAMDSSQIGFLLKQDESPLSGTPKYAYCQKIFLYKYSLTGKGTVQLKQYCVGR